MDSLRPAFKFGRVMMRAMAALLIAVTCGFPLLAGAQSVHLKRDVVVADKFILMGDIFEGLPRGADKVLGAAPAPGSTMTLNARTLLRIALAAGIDWRPASSAEQVTISRAATLVRQETIKTALQQKLKDQGLDGKYDLAVPGGLKDIALPASEIEQVEIASMDVREKDSTFTAVLVAPSREKPLQRVSVAGTMRRLIDVPVLKETLQAGTIIGARDIETVEMRETDLRPDTVLDPQTLIGQTPRRMISARRAVSAADIEPPRLVARGDLVTMVFSSGSLRLTAQGKALEHGTKGDTIRVANTASSKTVEAMVTNAGEVTVRSF